MHGDHCRVRGGGDGHLSWIMLLVGVGLNCSGDPDKTLCWELVSREEVRPLVGLSGGVVAGSRGSREGIRLEVGVGLNSRGGGAMVNRF